MAEKPTYEELEKRVRDIEQAESKRKHAEAAIEKRILASPRLLKDDENITFEDMFNLDDIQRLQDEFAKATNVASIITHTDGTPITKPSNFCRLCNDIIRKTDKGLANCFKSDAMIGRFHPDGPIVQPCMSGGLWDAGAGVTVGGRHIANWLIGQVRDETQTEDKMLEYAKKIGAREKDVVEAFHEVPAMSHEQFKQVAKVLFTLANQLSTAAYQNVQQARFITERKHAEEALRESEKLFRHISDTTFEGIVFHDQGKIIYANDQYYNMFGYTKEELKGVNAISLTVSPISIAKMKKMISSGNLGPYEVIGIKKNGDKFPIEIHAKISEYHGQKIRMAAIRDLTRYKQAEEDTRKALEYAAEQSKHALIGQVAGKMAHDFNNILMGIMGNAQLALLDYDDQKIKKRLENINEFSERGKDITSNLISFSKDQEPKQTYFKVENKIELVLKMLEKDLAGIEVSRNYKKGIPELLADPGMIQDVLTNLIQNSIHAMSKVENPTLNLKVYSQDGKVYFEINDNGCGIPKEHQNSIYTPSFTLKGSQDETGSYKLGIKGTGYGMSNVKKYIVEKHKGDISLESEVGKGTKITIALKIIKRQLSSDEKKEVVKSQIYDKRRILLVEDEHAIADVQYQILTKEPFSHIVSIAVNGQMAIDIFNRNKFDAVSLDYMLPGDINGLDVYNHIRENNKDIPVVFISGNIEFITAMNKLKEKDPNLDHLSKPVNNLDYVNKINELIGKRI